MCIGSRLNQQAVALVAVFCGAAILGVLWPAGAAAQTDTDRAEFLRLSDLAVTEFNKPYSPHFSQDDLSSATHHAPFFEDSYAVRALNVGYEMTGDSRYGDAATLWTNRIVGYQNQMIPTGAYFLNYNYKVGNSYYRQPNSSTGQWLVADSGCIGMSVMSTYVHTVDTAQRSQYLASLNSFSNLVINNYVRSDGGITDGIWNGYADQWWCSTATFGSMSYLLYDQTGDARHWQAASNATNWMLTHDFYGSNPPEWDGLGSSGAPGVALYVGEFYALALDHLPQDDPRRTAIVGQVDELLDWMADNQKTQNPNSTIDYWGHTHMAGLPYLQFVLARELGRDDLIPVAKAELEYIVDLIDADGPRVSRNPTWSMITWAMTSYAELLSPGALYNDPAPVPEPSTFVLAAIGLAFLSVPVLRKRVRS